MFNKFSKNWSKDRDTLITDNKFFYETPHLDTRLWTYSFQFARSNYSVIATKQEAELKSYYFCNEKANCINAQFIQLYKKQEWEHFANYVDWLNKVCRVDINSENWSLSKCTCTWFKKNYICSHMVGMCIRLGLCEAPPIAQNIEIGKHRGVGRPTNVAPKSAWLEQPSTYSSQFDKPTVSASIPPTSSSSSAWPSQDKLPEVNSIDEEIPTAQAPKRGRGRPPGSLNKVKKKI